VVAAFGWRPPALSRESPILAIRDARYHPQMPHFPKPAEGSWTQHYPYLGTAPVSYDDSISPEFYALEQEAIFAKCWLNVGRVEMIPRTGSFFTKEIAAARTSVVVVRSPGGEVKAYHNMCRHRGNKLVWEDYPGEEVSGTCRQFVCKYHGWRYNLDGDLTFVQQEEEFFDLDKDQFGLVPVQVDVWEGFVFVNLDLDNKVPLREYLGEFAGWMEGFPFGEMTQVYKYRADVNANWKLYIDAFAEFYHAPVLHAKQYVGDESSKLMGFGFEGLHYELRPPHGMVSSWGGMAPPKDPMMVKPVERILRSGNFGPWDRPDIPNLFPPGVNPSGNKSWGLDSYLLFPNFMVLIWAPGWYLTYHYWPVAYNRHIFEGTMHFVPPKDARDRLRQELAAVTFKEFGLQDCNTLEATQTMLESRRIHTFPLNDQEIMLRHLHHTARDYVAAHEEHRDPPHGASRAHVGSPG
jgi:phenylpropionate dioxygenase-like ring-hydroxylating dioxygenase large terminal subunit